MPRAPGALEHRSLMVRIRTGFSLRYPPPMMDGLFDFGPFPELRTERLWLRALDSIDVDDIFAFRGDPIVQLYNSKPHDTLEETLAFIEQQHALYRQQRECLWAVTLPYTDHDVTRRDGKVGRVVGEVSIQDWDRYHRHASIGYDFTRAEWGKGYAQEACRAVLRFGFQRMNLNRIEIWTAAANTRSLRLAERLGFSKDGLLRRRILEDDGAFHDSALFGLLRSEWEAAVAPPR
jgi:ribosomal-protein-alanine N-acetyltransferase